MNNREAVNWLTNVLADIGKAEHSDLWHYEQALTEIKDMLESAQPDYKWETCYECPLSHGCPKIKGCTNEQATEYASQIPGDCPLSAQPEERTDKRTETRACDLISRQAAIDALNTGFWGVEWDKALATAILKDLPPAQPERNLIDDYMWKIKQNISPHTSAEGVIAIKYYLSQIYEQIYGKGEKPKWMT